MNEQTQKLLDEIAERGWSVNFSFNWDGNWDAEHAYAGDCNCPHPKEWDPSDGHGWSSVEIPIDAYPDQEPWSLDTVVQLIHAEIMKIEPGAPHTRRGGRVSNAPARKAGDEGATPSLASRLKRLFTGER